MRTLTNSVAKIRDQKGSSMCLRIFSRSCFNLGATSWYTLEEDKDKRAATSNSRVVDKSYGAETYTRFSFSDTIESDSVSSLDIEEVFVVSSFLGGLKVGSKIVLDLESLPVESDGGRLFESFYNGEYVLAGFSHQFEDESSNTTLRLVRDKLPKPFSEKREQLLL